MNPSLPPQISSERSPQRWSAERSIVPTQPSCSFEIKRPRSSSVHFDRSAIALPQANTASQLPPASFNHQTINQPEISQPASHQPANNQPASHQPASHQPAIPSHPHPEPPEPQSLPQKAARSHPSPNPSANPSPHRPTPAPSVQPSSSEEVSVIPMRSLPVPAQTTAVTSAPGRPQAPPHRVSSYASAHKATITVQPFSVQQDMFKEPSLPRLKQVQLNSHRHSHNPVFPLSLLQDIATIVEDWQAQLDELHEQIQAIYLDGPIVDGWLEAEATLDGVIQGYRLCGLDDQGQMWARPCPPDQLPSVSTAIARYQHLRQILAQKQALEVRFQQLGETLAMVRSSL